MEAQGLVKAPSGPPHFLVTGHARHWLFEFGLSLLAWRGSRNLEAYEDFLLDVQRLVLGDIRQLLTDHRVPRTFPEGLGRFGLEITQLLDAYYPDPLPFARLTPGEMIGVLFHLILEADPPQRMPELILSRSLLEIEEIGRDIVVRAVVNWCGFELEKLGPINKEWLIRPFSRR